MCLFLCVLCQLKATAKCQSQMWALTKASCCHSFDFPTQPPLTRTRQGQNAADTDWLGRLRTKLVCHNTLIKFLTLQCSVTGATACSATWPSEQLFHRDPILGSLPGGPARITCRFKTPLPHTPANRPSLTTAHLTSVLLNQRQPRQLSTRRCSHPTHPGWSCIITANGKYDDRMM